MRGVVVFREAVALSVCFYRLDGCLRLAVTLIHISSLANVPLFVFFLRWHSPSCCLCLIACGLSSGWDPQGGISGLHLSVSWPRLVPHAWMCRSWPCHSPRHHTPSHKMMDIVTALWPDLVIRCQFFFQCLSSAVVCLCGLISWQIWKVFAQMYYERKILVIWTTNRSLSPNSHQWTSVS